MSRPANTGPVLPWKVHDRRHAPNPFTGRSTYMLDRVEDDSLLLYCHFCGHYVHPREDTDAMKA